MRERMLQCASHLSDFEFHVEMLPATNLRQTNTISQYKEELRKARHDLTVTTCLLTEKEIQVTRAYDLVDLMKRELAENKEQVARYRDQIRQLSTEALMAKGHSTGFSEGYDVGKLAAADCYTFVKTLTYQAQQRVCRRSGSVNATARRQPPLWHAYDCGNPMVDRVMEATTNSRDAAGRLKQEHQCAKRRRREATLASRQQAHSETQPIPGFPVAVLLTSQSDSAPPPAVPDPPAPVLAADKDGAAPPTDSTPPSAAIPELPINPEDDEPTLKKARTSPHWPRWQFDAIMPLTGVRFLLSQTPFLAFFAIALYNWVRTSLQSPHVPARQT
ncbi:hypothetical protein FISHEDRAFT_72043 [Fistulina hepatica ATCC 64428]|uniref:Uncharacterized protein n=1 Tax=Fistulina hepatica ATCC 64428 TaxID=1128425 RepID=A0A0D7AFC0_9AGAR|nr:hypothetical protein FISHEDRAFT_72043 [Fistulina hepatica ATCC 64428]